MRVDRWLRQQFPHAPQSFLQKQLRQRKIRILTPTDTSQSIPAKPHAILRAGDSIAIDAVLFEKSLAGMAMNVSILAASSKSPSIDQEASTLNGLIQRIIYQDDNFLALNKPHGLAVQHGTALDQSLADFLPALGVATNGDTPRLVHRLDKETSGILVLARHRLAAARFSESLRDGSVSKTYDALVRPIDPERNLPPHGEINRPIDGKPATTTFIRSDRSRADTDDGTQWLEMKPVTGRKHQLRIHCAQGLHAPIVGDSRHGSPRERRAHRLMLHAKRIAFSDPFAPGRVIDVTCEMIDTPADPPRRR